MTQLEFLTQIFAETLKHVDFKIKHSRSLIRQMCTLGLKAQDEVDIKIGPHTLNRLLKIYLNNRRIYERKIHGVYYYKESRPRPATRTSGFWHVEKAFIPTTEGERRALSYGQSRALTRYREELRCKEEKEKLKAGAAP